jgi:hypothetical protein
MEPMDDIHRLEAKGLARAKIRSKRRRVQLIRRRTIRGSVALFAVAWALIFGQLVTGNDPALSRSRLGAHKLLASAHRPRRSGAEGGAVLPTPAPVEEAVPSEETGSGEEAAPVEEAAPEEAAPVEEAPASSAETPSVPAPVITAAS